MILILLSLTIFSIALTIQGERNIKHAREQLIETATATMTTACEKYALENVNIKVHIEGERYIKGYYVEVQANMPTFSSHHLYACVKELRFLCPNKDFHWYSANAVVLNGVKFWTEYDGRLMSENGYIPCLEYDDLATQYPYDGMPESILRYTILGEPDEVEYCHNYNSLKISHRFKVYRWYENGKLKASAQVSSWDHKKNIVVPEYLYAVHIF